LLTIIFFQSDRVRSEPAKSDGEPPLQRRSSSRLTTTPTLYSSSIGNEVKSSSRQITRVRQNVNDSEDSTDDEDGDNGPRYTFRDRSKHKRQVTNLSVDDPEPQHVHQPPRFGKRSVGLYRETSSHSRKSNQHRQSSRPPRRRHNRNESRSESSSSDSDSSTSGYSSSSDQFEKRRRGRRESTGGSRRRDRGGVRTSLLPLMHHEVTMPCVFLQQ
jgi:hypothetical protein